MKLSQILNESWLDDEIKGLEATVEYIKQNTKDPNNPKTISTIEHLENRIQNYKIRKQQSESWAVTQDYIIELFQVISSELQDFVYPEDLGETDIEFFSSHAFDKSFYFISKVFENYTITLKFEAYKIDDGVIKEIEINFGAYSRVHNPQRTADIEYTFTNPIELSSNVNAEAKKLMMVIKQGIQDIEQEIKQQEEDIPSLSEILY